MKSFYTVLVLFLAMSLAIGINYIYIGKLSQSLIDECESLSAPTPDTAARAKDIHDHWHANRKFVHITANHAEMDAIDNALDTLVAYAGGESNADFQNAKRLAINALEELRSTEQFSLLGVL